MDIKLTLAERLVLANQYEILCELRNDPYAKRLAENLRNGYEFLYRDVLESVSPEMDKASTEFVLDTLSMYQAIKNSWEDLGKPAEIKAVEVDFPGFDGNNEGRFYGFACALADDNRFTEQLGTRGKNSHSPKVSTYRRMLAVWKEQEDQYALTKEQIQVVLAARGY